MAPETFYYLKSLSIWKYGLKVPENCNYLCPDYSEY